MNRSIFFIPVLAVMIAGCGNADYERNNDGLVYRIIKSGSGELIKPKTFLKIDQRAEMGDTVFFSTFGKLASYGFFDSVASPAHEFLDILDKMRVGDSAIVIRSVDTLVKRGVAQYTNRMIKGSTIKVTIKALAVYKSEAEFEVARAKETEEYKQKEIAALDIYLKNNVKKDLIRTKGGVFLEIEKEGSGEKIDTGMQVTMMYTGRLLDGKVFDSNIDSTFNHTTPYKFVVGAKEVIEGWDIGALELKKGSKAKIYVPSMLGYGNQGNGPKIPPYSTLVFSLEVLDAAFPQATVENMPGLKPH